MAWSPADGLAMGLPEVTNILWRERNLLELLLFKLEEERFVLAGGKARWLPRATHEVELVLGEIRAAELARVVEVDAAAAELGIGPSPSLRQLAAVAPPPWGGLLEQHRAAFLEATQEITSLARLNHDLLAAGARAAEEALGALVGVPESAAPTCRPPGGPRPVHAARTFDEAL